MIDDSGAFAGRQGRLNNDALAGTGGSFAVSRLLVGGVSGSQTLQVGTATHPDQFHCRGRVTSARTASCRWSRAPDSPAAWPSEARATITRGRTIRMAASNPRLDGAFVNIATIKVESATSTAINVVNRESLEVANTGQLSSAAASLVAEHRAPSPPPAPAGCASKTPCSTRRTPSPAAHRGGLLHQSYRKYRAADPRIVRPTRAQLSS